MSVVAANSYIFEIQKISKESKKIIYRKNMVKKRKIKFATSKNSDKKRLTGILLENVLWKKMRQIELVDCSDFEQNKIFAAKLQRHIESSRRAVFLPA